MTKKLDWLFITKYIAHELIPPKEWGQNQWPEIHAFIDHVADQLVIALKRGDIIITETLILQLNVLRSLHGMQMEKDVWGAFLEKIALILGIGSIFL